MWAARLRGGGLEIGDLLGDLAVRSDVSSTLGVRQLVDGPDHPPSTFHVLDLPRAWTSGSSSAISAATSVTSCAPTSSWARAGRPPEPARRGAARRRPASAPPCALVAAPVPRPPPVRRRSTSARPSATASASAAARGRARSATRSRRRRRARHRRRSRTSSGAADPPSISRSCSSASAAASTPRPVASPPQGALLLRGCGRRAPAARGRSGPGIRLAAAATVRSASSATASNRTRPRRVPPVLRARPPAPPCIGTLDARARCLSAGDPERGPGARRRPLRRPTAGADPHRRIACPPSASCAAARAARPRQAEPPRHGARPGQPIRWPHAGARPGRAPRVAAAGHEQARRVIRNLAEVVHQPRPPEHDRGARASPASQARTRSASGRPAGPASLSRGRRRWHEHRRAPASSMPFAALDHRLTAGRIGEYTECGAEGPLGPGDHLEPRTEDVGRRGAGRSHGRGRAASSRRRCSAPPTAAWASLGGRVGRIGAFAPSRRAVGQRSRPAARHGRLSARVVDHRRGAPVGAPPDRALPPAGRDGRLRARSARGHRPAARGHRRRACGRRVKAASAHARRVARGVRAGAAASAPLGRPHAAARASATRWAASPRDAARPRAHPHRAPPSARPPDARAQGRHARAGARARTVEPARSSRAALAGPPDAPATTAVGARRARSAGVEHRACAARARTAQRATSRRRHELVPQGTEAQARRQSPAGRDDLDIKFGRPRRGAGLALERRLSARQLGRQITGALQALGARVPTWPRRGGGDGATAPRRPPPRSRRADRSGGRCRQPRPDPAGSPPAHRGPVRESRAPRGRPSRRHVGAVELVGRLAAAGQPTGDLGLRGLIVLGMSRADRHPNLGEPRRWPALAAREHHLGHPGARSRVARCSPIDQTIASARLLLPDPLGPTITLTPGPNSRSTGVANDLKPRRCQIAAASAAVLTGGEHRRGRGPLRRLFRGARADGDGTADA